MCPLMKLSSEKQARSVPFRISVKYDKKDFIQKNLFLTKGRSLQIGLYPKKEDSKLIYVELNCLYTVDYPGKTFSECGL